MIQNATVSTHDAPSIGEPALQLVSSVRSFQRKDLLPLEPDSVWSIEQGIVRTLTWDEEGRTIGLGFWGQGDVLGLPLSPISPYQAECITPVKVAKLSLDSRHLQEGLIRRARKSEELLTIVHQPSVVMRLLQLLEWLATHFGQPVPGGRSLDVLLTHQELAETISTTRVTVTRLLSQLEQEGKIERSQRNLTLLVPNS